MDVLCREKALNHLLTVVAMILLRQHLFGSLRPEDRREEDMSLPACATVKGRRCWGTDTRCFLKGVHVYFSPAIFVIPFVLTRDEEMVPGSTVRNVW